MVINAAEHAAIVAVAGAVGWFALLPTFRDGLKSWVVPVFIRGEGGNFLTVWFTYLLAGLFALSLQMVVGFGTPHIEFIHRTEVAFLTMTVVGVFRVQCVVLSPGLSPMGVGVWVLGAAGLGAYVLLAAAFGHIVTFDMPDEVDVSEVFVGSLLAFLGVDAILGLVLWIERRRRSSRATGDGGE